MKKLINKHLLEILDKEKNNILRKMDGFQTKWVLINCNIEFIYFFSLIFTFFHETVGRVKKRQNE